MKKFMPIFDWARHYDRHWLKGDLMAGFTVGVVLIPQGMAYAMIAGLPPVYGLYAALVPQAVYALFGTSRQLSLGPVATDSLLVFAGLSAIAQMGTEHYAIMAITLAMMVGAMQLLLGFVRFGFIANFLSKPVISAFVCAAGLIIGINQLKHLLGIRISNSQHAYDILLQIISGIEEFQWISFLIGTLGIAILVLVKKLKIPIPGALIIVALGIVAVKFLGLENQGVAIIGAIPSGFPSLRLPQLELGDLKTLFPAAATLAVISFMEAISVSKAIAERHKEYQLEPNQELIAMGMANLVGSLFQSFPCSGGLSRSAINEQAGAKTPLAPIISAIVVGITLIFLTPLFFYLPKAILAAIILVGIQKLIDFKYPLRLWGTMKDEFIVYAMTFLTTLGIGIIEGIITGVVTALFALIYRTAHPHIAELALVRGTRHYKNIARFKDVMVREDVLVLRFDAQLYFANVDYFKSQLAKLAEQKGEALKLVVLNSEAINHVDATALMVLEDIIKGFKRKGVLFYLAGAKGPIRDTLYHNGLIRILGEESLFVKTIDAVSHFDKNTGQETYALREMATQAKKKGHK